MIRVSAKFLIWNSLTFPWLFPDFFLVFPDSPSIFHKLFSRNLSSCNIQNTIYIGKIRKSEIWHWATNYTPVDPLYFTFSSESSSKFSKERYSFTSRKKQIVSMFLLLSYTVDWMLGSTRSGDSSLNEYCWTLYLN